MQNDQYNPRTMLTTQGKDFLRFLAATEGGELYMIAFHLQVLKEITQNGIRPLSEAAQDASNQPLLRSLMCVEFLGARLSHCSSLVKLGPSGLIYYSSRSGDSYVLKVTSEKQGDEQSTDPKEVCPSFNPDLSLNDRPYLQVVEEHQSLAPVIDIQLRSEQPNGSEVGQTKL